MGTGGSMRALGAALVAGAAGLAAFAGAASMALLPGQLDSAGRQACSMTLGTPSAERRAEAVALARRSDSQGLRDAADQADPGPAEARFRSVELWCASND